MPNNIIEENKALKSQLASEKEFSWEMQNRNDELHNRLCDAAEEIEKLKKIMDEADKESLKAIREKEKIIEIQDSKIGTLIEELKSLYEEYVILLANKRYQDAKQED